MDQPTSFLPYFHALYIIQMVTIQQLLRHQPTDTQALDLRSSKPEKIHRIDSLQPFTNLRSLNLSNNMITKIQNLNTLIHLRILNLQFNQISKLEGIKHLARLEELFLSYNCIEVISGDVRHNQGLRVLHLAYNDLKSIEDLRPLANMQQLTILSLVGNPFLSALNYIAFVKMLIPSLLLLDDRDANQSIIAANVYPHQEIFILRDALNKLLDERNHRQQEQAQMTSHPQKESAGKYHKASPRRSQAGDREPLLELLSQWIETYARKAEAKRQEINELSESYSQCMKNSKRTVDKQEADIIAKINKYRMQEERGQLSQVKKQKLMRMSREMQRNEQAENNSREESRALLQLLKNKEGDYGKLKEKEQILKELRMKVENSPQPNRVLISHLIFGRSSHQLDYRDIKRFLYDGKGLLYYLSTLKQVIFGEQADTQRIDRLKEFLGDKSLIQIINDLKQMGIKHKKQRKKYEKQRAKLIEKFQGEAQELCEQWRDLQKQKWIMKNSRKSEQQDTSKSFLDERFAVVENEERTKIMLLKKEKEHYQAKVEELQQKYEGLEVQFSRKYQELEEFQRFFEEFKQEREIVNGLKGEIDTVSQDLASKQKLQDEIESHLRELTAREASLMEKSSFYERKCYEKAEELKLIEQKARSQQDRAKRASEEVSLRHSQEMSLHQQLTRIAQELREGEKKLERQRSSLEVYQQKLRNLSELQNNKRNSLNNLEAQVESQRKHLTELTHKVQQAQEKLNRCLQAGYQAQLRLQQSRKSTESLADINRLVSDMLERQTQLRRNVLQLQLQTQHLTQVKSQLMREIKLHYDDQDDNL